MKQDPLTKGGSTATSCPGRIDSIGVMMLASTPSSTSTLSSSISSLSSSISSSSSLQEERRKGDEEFICGEEEEGEVVSVSIVTIAEESCPSEPFGTVAHVEVAANESAVRDGDCQSKTSRSTQTEEEEKHEGEGGEGVKEKDQGEEEGEMAEDESDHSALLEEEDEGRNQVFVSDDNLGLSDSLTPGTPTLLNIKVLMSTSHGVRFQTDYMADLTELRELFKHISQPHYIM
ncbi:uncharacterized protein LOC120035896 [Salvelinus namaycush]|uniref:Uncharacterized protein LOC120035896 n=1 Tax=Salvelinus namaycush TaxID=8040 RepID=A0A8U0Q7Y8_SALNM|nr:uncharacterized protein LOC120035896 [Salvelinus namaycush]